MESYIGAEYHWFPSRSFYAKLDRTYREPGHPPVRERTWQCQLLTAFALGASYCRFDGAVIHVTDEVRDDGESRHTIATNGEARKEQSDSSLPGAKFFDQAMSLFKMPTEVLTLGHIEALNLMVRICASSG